MIGGEQELISSRWNWAVPQPLIGHERYWGSFTEYVNKRENKGGIRVVVKPVRFIWFTGKKRLVCVREGRGALKGPKKPNTNDNRHSSTTKHPHSGIPSVIFTMGF